MSAGLGESFAVVVRVVVLEPTDTITNGPEAPHDQESKEGPSARAAEAWPVPRGPSREPVPYQYDPTQWSRVPHALRSEL